VALGFWLGTGSVLESERQAGISHLLEHMLFRGSERYGSEEIDQIFDAMGAEVNAGTDKEATSVYTRVLDRHLERAFGVLSDMVWHPRFGELEADLPGIASNVLSQRLKHLEKAGVVVSRPYSSRPPRYAYELTAAGYELTGALRLLGQWGADHLEGVGQGPTHASCGTALEARWYCPTCDRTVGDASYDAEEDDLRYL